jgi:TPR repeat protein
MNRTFKTAVAALTFAVGFAGSVAAGEVTGVTANFTKGQYAALLTLVEQGNADAQAVLGLVYYEGRVVPQDYAAAAMWYRKAAEQGHAEAQIQLGVLYHDGEGVPQDDAAAVRWFRKATEQSNARAQFLLGIMYLQGTGVPQDYVLAHMWLNLAGAAGYKPAGEFRDRGRGDDAHADRRGAEAGARMEAKRLNDRLATGG